MPHSSFPSPGKKPILIFKLSEGLELLLPRPKKKSEPSEEEKGEFFGLKGSLLLLGAAGMGAGLGGSLQQLMVGRLCCCFPQIQVQIPAGRRCLRSVILPRGMGGCSQRGSPPPNPTSTGCAPPKITRVCAGCWSAPPSPGTVTENSQLLHISVGASLIPLHDQNSLG